MKYGLVALAMGAGLLGGCASARTQGLTIDFAVTGAVQATGSLSHVADAGHFCASAALPALHAVTDGLAVETPPGPPVYLVQYDPEASAAQPGLILRSFAYQPGQLVHSDPADDWVQITVGGQTWAGHGAQGAFQDGFTFAADGRSGRLTAHGLLVRTPSASADPGQSVDLVASWSCPPP